MLFRKTGPTSFLKYLIYHKIQIKEALYRRIKFILAKEIRFHLMNSRILSTGQSYTCLEKARVRAHSQN
jgi:hypothetical protein